MKDNEIIKALERCGQHRECCYCNSVEECGSKRVLTASALDLINRQNAEMKSLTEKLEVLGDPLQDAQYKIAEQQAEIERLLKLAEEQNAEIKRLQEARNKLLYGLKQICKEQDENNIRAEAIKEFEEKLYSMIDGFEDYDTLHIYEIKDRIDLVKEKMGDIPKIEHYSLCETDTYKVGE